MEPFHVLWDHYRADIESAEIEAQKSTDPVAIVKVIL
jgi:hypothetical protein